MTDKRISTRIECDLHGSIENASSKISCRINNISKHGAGGTVGSFLILNIGQKVTIYLGDIAVRSAIVRWIGSGKFGTEFRKPFTDNEISKMVRGQAA